MKIKLQTIGNAEIEMEVTNEKELISRLAFYQSLPTKCGICGSPVVFSHRQPQGYDYYGLVCEGSPKHESNFGQNREGGKLFFKGDWREVQYNSVAAERDAEIQSFDQPTNQRDELIGRITKAQKIIRDLGGSVERVELNRLSIGELVEELNVLTEQFTRLKSRQKQPA